MYFRQLWNRARSVVRIFWQRHFSRRPCIVVVSSNYPQEYGIDSPEVRALAARIDARAPRRGKWKTQKLPSPSHMRGLTTCIFSYVGDDGPQWYALRRYRDNRVVVGASFVHELYAHFVPVESFAVVASSDS